MLDLLIRGGDLVDGSGAPRRRADVGVRGDRVVAIGELGELDDDAVRVIDASGRVITPGFVDVHTHYDAQVFWDGTLSPSPLHGVTTALAGNCGFSIAPLSTDATDAEYLMRMLARVEGMPIDALREGVPWDWQSTASYLDAIEGRLGINAGFMAGHSAIRRVVMGPQAARRAADDHEIDQMRRLLHDALEAGAIGFSSSWARTHNDADGRMVPSRHATEAELVSLCRIVGMHPGTSVEFIPQLGPFFPWAVDLMAAMSSAAGRPLNWNVLLPASITKDAAYEKLAASDTARGRGGTVVALVMPLRTTTHFSFVSGFALDAIPGWAEFIFAPTEQKVATLADAEGRRRLAELARRPDNPTSFSQWSDKVIFDVCAPENEEYRGRELGEISRELGRDPFDVLCDIVVADELGTTFGSVPPQPTREDWEMRVEICRDPRGVIGASDAGAHLDLFALFNYTTVLLDECVRRHGLMSLEEAVHLMTAVPAGLYGIKDRGRIAEGWYADLVVMDPATVASREVATRYDLPGGAPRLYADAVGIDNVIVNGVEAVRDGTLTEERAGTVLRSGRDTATPSLA
jgi:N-acyl-D-aspartate/D-glutamate deacylase